jgi:hypothetical protein
MFTSCTPCGDGSLLLQADEKDSVYWTGAKPLLESDHAMAEGVTRMKPGRSDIPKESRSHSMSCSDKILKWNHLGIQGGLFKGKILLSSIVIEC